MIELCVISAYPDEGRDKLCLKKTATCLPTKVG